MALITCKNCGHPVSDKAPACPHCGTEIEPAATQARPEPGAEFVPDTEECDKPTISPMVAIIAIAIIAIGAIAGYYLYQQEMERQRAEFVRDSLAQVERERIAAERARIAAEKARQDSIRRVRETIVNGYLNALQREKRNCTEGLYVEYFLFDITHDDIPDLLVNIDGFEAGRECVIYSYVDGTVKKIETFSMTHAGLYKGDGYLVHNWAIQGNQAIDRITYSNGKFHYKTIFKGTEWEERANQDGYVYIDEYRSVPEPAILWIDDSNKQPIHNISI